MAKGARRHSRQALDIMAALLRNLVIVLAILLGAAFSFYNLQSVTVDFLWARVDVPLVVVLVAAFVLGFVVALLVLTWKLTRLRGRLAQARRELKDARTEIRNLRSMPIHDA